MQVDHQLDPALKALGFQLLELLEKYIPFPKLWFSDVNLHPSYTEAVVDDIIALVILSIILVLNDDDPSPLHFAAPVLSAVGPSVQVHIRLTFIN